MRLSPLVRRLLPLFVAKFLLNFVFWYSIEKIFMTTIGFDNASIGLMVAVYSIMSVTMEIPSGILADRWSRKGVMILAAVSLALSGFIGYLSSDVTVFIMSAVFWGFFDAFASGTSDSIIYDTLLEEEGNANKYEKILGFYHTLGGIALVISALIGGMIGDQFGLRFAFLWGVVPALAAIGFLMAFRDAMIHKQSDDTLLIEHTKQTFRAVFRNPNLIWILVSLLAVMIANNLTGEMYQLWFLALDTPVVIYGIAGAIVLSTYGAGGLFVKFFTSKRNIVSAMLMILAACIVLVFSRHVWLTIGMQFITGLLTFILIISFTGQMHRHLPSKYRAGAGSAINTVGRLMFIPLALGFGWVSENTSIFVATWILVALVLVGLYSELHTILRRKSVQ